MIIRGEAQVTLHLKNGVLEKAQFQVSGEDIHELVGSVGAEIETALRNPFHKIELENIICIELVIRPSKIS